VTTETPVRDRYQWRSARPSGLTAAAHNSFTMEREATIDVAADQNGLVGLTPGTSRVVTTQSEKLSIDLNGVLGGSANGQNRARSSSSVIPRIRPPPSLSAPQTTPGARVTSISFIISITPPTGRILIPLGLRPICRSICKTTPRRWWVMRRKVRISVRRPSRPGRPTTTANLVDGQSRSLRIRRRARTFILTRRGGQRGFSTSSRR
jgi:hypothetical protein